MHRSAYEQMELCIKEYLPVEGPADGSASGVYRVVDLGSRVSGKQTRTHRALLAGHPVDYFGVDVQDGPNVDAVMTKPYRIPARSNSADVVLSGQAFEHIPFFWASMLEIARILKPADTRSSPPPRAVTSTTRRTAGATTPTDSVRSPPMRGSNCARPTPTSRPGRASGTTTGPSTGRPPTGATPSASSASRGATPG